MATHNEKVLALLSDGLPHSHHEVYALHVIGHSRVASLRAKGYEIAAWRVGDTHWYQLTAGATSLRTAAEHVPELQRRW